MADISQLTINNTTYDIKDTVARNQYILIDELGTSPYTYEEIYTNYLSIGRPLFVGDEINLYRLQAFDDNDCLAFVKVVSSDAFECNVDVLLLNEDNEINDFVCTLTSVSPNPASTTSTLTGITIGDTSYGLAAGVSPSDFVSGHVTLSDAASHNHSVTLPLLTITTTSTAFTAAGSATPLGSVTALSPTYTKTTITGATTTSEVNKIGYTETDASVTGASYTPEGSVSLTHTSTALTETSHSHDAGTLAGTVGTGITLTSSNATATGKIRYIDSTAFTANTPTAVTLPTFTSATYTSVAYGPVYTSSTKTLAFSLATVSGGTFTAGSVTNGTAASFTPTVSYIGAALTSGAVSITGSTGSTSTGATYDKATSASFNGSASTITPTVKYSKVSSIYYSRATGGTGTFSGSATSISVSGSMDIPTAIEYSTASSLTSVTTTSVVGGAKTSTYMVLSPSNVYAGVYPSVIIPKKS